MFRKGFISLVICLLLLVSFLSTAFSQEKVTLTLWCHVLILHKEGFEAVAQEFYKTHPNIEIKVEPQSDIATKWKAAIAARRAPDMFTPRAEDMLEAVLTKSIEPLPEDVLSVKDLKSKFWPEYYLQAPFDKAYAVGIPDPPGDAGLVVNVDLLKKAGLPIPAQFKSMTELLRYAQKLTKKDDKGNLIQAGLSCREYNNQVFLWDFIGEQGGHFYNNETGLFDYSIPEAKKALQFFYDLHYKYGVDSIKLPDTYNALSQGVAAMGFMWGEYVEFAKRVYPNMNFSFVLKPSFVEGRMPIFSHVDTWNLAVWSGSPHKKEAFEFMKFLATPKAQEIFMKINPGMPPLIELSKPRYFADPKQKYLAAFLKFLPKMTFWGPFGNDSIIKDTLYRIMDGVEHNTMSIDEGLSEMTKKSNEALNTFRTKYPDAPKPVIKYPY